MINMGGRFAALSEQCYTQLYQGPLQTIYVLARRHVPTPTVVADLVSVHRLWFHEVADLCLVSTRQVRDLALGHAHPRARSRSWASR
jgi:hypothetical protein